MRIKNNLKILDKYIVKQFIETFLVSLVIFTTLIFATDAFTTIVKQILEFGIPLHIAATLVILKIPSMLVLTIPMGILLATLMTVNKMNNDQEITIFRSCAIGIDRISKPIMICAILGALGGFFINEVIAPVAGQQAKTLTIWAIMQKNVPNGKKNFIYKETQGEVLKRFFHIASVEKKKLNSITVLDLSQRNAIQVIYAKTGKTAPEGWILENGVVYTISNTGKILNTAAFTSMTFDNTAEAIEKIADVKEGDFNYFDLRKYIKTERKNINQTLAKDQKLNSLVAEYDINERKKEIEKRLLELEILMNEKFALPFMAIAFALIAIPLGITGPRARFNRGLIFSIIILFCYYILRAISVSLGQAGILIPVIAAWTPNIITLAVGYWLYHRKAYRI